MPEKTTDAHRTQRNACEHQHGSLGEGHYTRSDSDQDRLPATGAGFEGRGHEKHDAQSECPMGLVHPLERYSPSIGRQPGD